MTQDTPARQPQHCDHEEICRFYAHDLKRISEIGLPCLRNYGHPSGCTYDSRATPTSPQAPAVREMFAEHQAYRNGYDDGYALAMNEAGDKIKAAREQVLDDIWKFVCAYQNQGVVKVVNLQVHLESLRAQQEQP